MAKIGIGGNSQEVIAAVISDVVAEAASIFSVGSIILVATSSVGVAARLEGLISANPAQISWPSATVGLLKLLRLDSSVGVGNELVAELGCLTEKTAGSARWRYKSGLTMVAIYLRTSLIDQRSCSVCTMKVLL